MMSSNHAAYYMQESERCDVNREQRDGLFAKLFLQLTGGRKVRVTNDY